MNNAELANKLKVAVISLDPLANSVDPELTKGLLQLKGIILEKLDPEEDQRPEAPPMREEISTGIEEPR